MPKVIDFGIAKAIDGRSEPERPMHRARDSSSARRST